MSDDNATQQEHVKLLMKKLFSDYDAAVRPIPHPQNTLNIILGIALRHLADVVNTIFRLDSEFIT